MVDKVNLVNLDKVAPTRPTGAEPAGADQVSGKNFRGWHRPE